MSEETKIEWCDRTWSPWEGCTKVSEGCANCYAENRNQRFNGGKNWGKGAPRRKTKDWGKPLRWNHEAERKGIRIRVFPSLCDPFDDEVPIEWLVDFLMLVLKCKNLDFLLLTKRPEVIQQRLIMATLHMAGYRDGQSLKEPIRPAELPTTFDEEIDNAIYGWSKFESLFESFPENIWVGVTCENQARADERIPILLQIPAKVRFVSCEPMLGPVDLNRWLGFSGTYECSPTSEVDFMTVIHPSLIDWVICGGESGPKARPMHPEWVRSLRDQCVSAGVPFFFKQWGEWGPVTCVGDWSDLREKIYTFDNGISVFRWGKKKNGRLLDGREWGQIPDFRLQGADCGFEKLFRAGRSKEAGDAEVKVESRNE